MFPAGQNLGTWNIMPGFTKGMHTIMRTFKLDCFSMCERMKIISKMYLSDASYALLRNWVLHFW